MSWNPGEPADTTKIRNLGVVIRPNWEAIEKADLSFKPQAINLNNRTQLPPEVPDDPTPIEDSYIVFSKEDSTGVAQLWGVDPENNISQLTSSDFQLLETGWIMLAPGLSYQWGRDTIAGGTSGKLTTFPRPFSDIPYVVLATVYGTPNADVSRGFGVEQATITATQFRAQNWNNGFTANTQFGWIAIGPQ